MCLESEAIKIENQQNTWREQTSNKKAENAPGCLGVCLLFITQLVLLFGCLIAGAGNVAYQNYLDEFEIRFTKLGLYELIVNKELPPYLPLLLSILAILFLIVGFFSFRRYLKWSTQKLAQNAVDGEYNRSEYEALRRKKYAKSDRSGKIMYLVQLVLSLIPAIFVIPTISFGSPNTSALIIATIVTLFAFGVFIFWLVCFCIISIVRLSFNSRALRKSQPTKQQVITQEMQRLFGQNCGYEPFGRFFVNPLETDVVKRYDNFTANDHIFGSYKRLYFEQMDVLLYNNVPYDPDSDISRPRLTAASRVTSDQAHRLKGLKGRWVIVHQPKTSSGKFYIINKNAYADELYRFKKLLGLDEVFLEDTEFNRRFVIYAEIPHDVFYVMTPPLIERLKRFADMGAGKSDFSLRLGFCQNRIHLVVCGLTDAFEDLFGALNTVNISISEESARMSVRRDLNLITDFIDSLFG